MPPGQFSRHLLVTGLTRVTDGQRFLLDREPFRFVPRPDTRRIVAKGGDTWQSLAFEHLNPVSNAEQLWWVLTDFQPEPVLDPTIPPVPGTIIYIPAPEFVLSELWAESRRDEDAV